MKFIDKNFLHRLVSFSLVLGLFVVVFGAYTRLTDSGLGCPDWPGCYGNIIPKVNSSKAWIEMIHRYVASTLGFLILLITVTVFVYRKYTPKKLKIIAVCLLLLVLGQGLLGMWTVTLRLYPIIVMAHLIGGLTILSTIWWMYLNVASSANYKQIIFSSKLKIIAQISLSLVVGQIILGGWTSANYAGLVCGGFPKCQDLYWPEMDWYNAFNFIKAGIFDSPGVTLENSSRVAIQITHRIGALITTVFISALCYKLYRSNLLKQAILLFTLLATQISLGIAIVTLDHSIFIALAHNAVAALLLLTTIWINKNISHAY